MGAVIYIVRLPRSSWDLHVNYFYDRPVGKRIYIK